MIYVLKAGDFHKIGYSSHVPTRVAEMQIGCPHKIEVVGTWAGSIDDEKEVHERFSDRRIRGEWFNLQPEDLEWIMSRAETPVPAKKKTGKTEIERRIEKARKEVRENRLGQHREIAVALGVHYNWVRRFASGQLREPGAIKFAHLESWLEKN